MFQIKVLGRKEANLVNSILDWDSTNLPWTRSKFVESPGTFHINLGYFYKEHFLDNRHPVDPEKPLFNRRICQESWNSINNCLMRPSQMLKPTNNNQPRVVDSLTAFCKKLEISLNNCDIVRKIWYANSEFTLNYVLQFRQIFPVRLMKFKIVSMLLFHLFYLNEFAFWKRIEII